MEDRLSQIAYDMRNSSGYGGAVRHNPVRVNILTMGCPKNEVDSLNMARVLAEAGAMIVEDAHEAECIIVNTCSFIQAATEESIAAVLDACELAEAKAGAKVVVAGCMPSRYGEDLAQAMPEVASFVECSKEDDIARVIGRLFPGRLGSAQLSIVLGAPSAYVKISDGCDRFCSFCAIPFIRGRYRSFSFGQVNAEVARAVAGGAREIVLIAQDTGRWGMDFREPSSLASLVDSLARKHPDIWFRLMYLQPEGVSDELLDVMAAHDNVASYLDIPFQHSSSSLIKSMNRRGSGEEYLQLIARIRNKVPAVSLRSTFIVGFPGETDEDFDNLCDFVEAAELDYVGIFPYSAEDGTRAALMPEQISDELKQERYQHLREIADSISSQLVSSRIGSTLDVLVLGREEDGQLYGRAQCQAPEVDGVVYLETGNIGDVRKTLICDTFAYEMEGR